MSRSSLIPRTAQYVFLGVLVVVAAALVVAAFTRVTPNGQSNQRAEARQEPQPSPTEATPTPVSLWLGDSYTGGAGAPSQEAAESCGTATLMGWSCSLDAQGGTGFLADGRANDESYSPLPDRLSDTVARIPEADVVIVDAGRNDGTTMETSAEVISAYFTRVRDAYPDATIVIVVPYFMDGTGRSDWYAQFASDEAESLEPAVVIDPIAEGWISEETADLTIADGVHPNAEGHRLIAENLARRLTELQVPLSS